MTELSDVVEALVDAHGVTGVLEALAMVCSEKAAHIEANYSDMALARAWMRAAAAIDKATAAKAVQALP